MNSKTLLILVIAIVLIAGTVFLFRGSQKESNPVSNPSGLIVGNNAIYAAEQLPGLSVLVSLARLEKPGFVVIHEDAAGSPGKILGASSLLFSGETKSLPSITLSRATRDGETIYIMLHADNGDGKFDAASDKPVLDSVGGAPMMMIVNVSKDAAEPGVVNP